MEKILGKARYLIESCTTDGAQTDAWGSSGNMSSMSKADKQESVPTDSFAWYCHYICHCTLY